MSKNLQMGLFSQQNPNKFSQLLLFYSTIIRKTTSSHVRCKPQHFHIPISSYVNQQLLFGFKIKRRDIIIVI
jgi:hypothetical protein